jgi:two-component sensor histidine kinase
LQKRSQKEQGAKDAFTSAVSRVHIIANAHNHLLPKEGQSLIDMREYLTVCCQNLGDALRDVRPIALNVNAAQILMREDRAVSVGLIVNELITNAFKYAFPNDHGGTVNVILRRESETTLELLVEDNGRGCPEDAKEGLGSRIVRLLAQQVGSTITRAAAKAVAVASPGTSFNHLRNREAVREHHRFGAAVPACGEQFEGAVAAGATDLILCASVGCPRSLDYPAAR